MSPDGKCRKEYPGLVFKLAHVQNCIVRAQLMSYVVIRKISSVTFITVRAILKKHGFHLP
jgi:hypothetical protein